jgi:hypothetical protein
LHRASIFVIVNSDRFPSSSDFSERGRVIDRGVSLEYSRKFSKCDREDRSSIMLMKSSTTFKVKLNIFRFGKLL